MSFTEIWLYGFLFSLIPLVLLWLLSVVLRNASIVDPYWSLGYVVISGYYLYTTGNYNPQTILVACLLATWGVRLSSYLLWRNWGQGEDYRYRQFRKDFGAHRYWWVSFFQVFLLQGTLIAVISLPVLATFLYSDADALSIADYVVTGLWCIGFFFEAIGDYQLTDFKKKNKANDQVLDSGLWRYSRHPNYFGNAVMWWAFGLFGVLNGSYFTLIGPLVMNVLLLKVSGVSLLERTLVNTKPKYREYISKTNAFFPWFPKSD